MWEVRVVLGWIARNWLEGLGCIQGMDGLGWFSTLALVGQEIEGWNGCQDSGRLGSGKGGIKGYLSVPVVLMAFKILNRICIVPYIFVSL